MQTIQRSRLHKFFVAVVALSASLGCTTPVFADSAAALLNPDGSLTYLHSPGWPYVFLSDLNDAGQVVGYFYRDDGAPHSFITGPGGVGMTDLGSLGGNSSTAYGINNAGQVVGESVTAIGSRHAFITGPNGVGMTDLGSQGGVGSYASRINNAGQVVEYSFAAEGSDGSPPIFITGPNGVGVIAYLHRGDGGEITVADINFDGHLAGTSYAPGLGSEHAFITGANGVGMNDLGTLGGRLSGARAINDAGQVVGNSNVANGELHAFITDANGVGIRDLGTLGGDYSAASDINDLGQVVGNSIAVNGHVHAFVTGPNGADMIDLNSVVSLPSGQYIDTAFGINNNGQIMVSVSGIPEPETHAMLLAGLALIGFAARFRGPG